MREGRTERARRSCAFEKMLIKIVNISSGQCILASRSKYNNCHGDETNSG